MRRTAIVTALISCAFALTACSSNSASTASAGSTGSKGSTGSASAGSATATASAETTSGPSNADLTSAELNARFKASATSVTALHYKGGAAGSGVTISVDMQVNKNSAQGTVAGQGVTNPIIAVNGVTYFQITPSFETKIRSDFSSASVAAASQVANLAEGKWISSQSGYGATLAQQMSVWTSLSQITATFAVGTDTYTYLSTSMQNGQSVAQYKDVDNSGSSPLTGTTDVPLHGLALPIDEEGQGGGATLVWNQPTTVTAPPAADVLTLPSP